MQRLRRAAAIRIPALPCRLRNFHTFHCQQKAIKDTHRLDISILWTLKDTKVDVARTNAILRKSDISGAEMGKLHSSRSLIRDLTRKKVDLRQEVKILGTELYDKGKDGQAEEDGNIIDNVSDGISEVRQRHRQRKEELKEVTLRLNEAYNEVQSILMRLPNSTHPDVPIGDERNAIMIGKGGDSSLIDDLRVKSALESVTLPVSLKELPDLQGIGHPDNSRDHIRIAEKFGWKNRRAEEEVNGTWWPILQGPLALLEYALVAYSIDQALKSKFELVTVPDAVKVGLLEKTGFQPRKGSGGQTFWLSVDGEQDARKSSENQLALSATAEIPLAGMNASITFTSKNDLPKQYVASSHAFRAEAGARGSESRGLYRVHQFTKVELFVICLPGQSQEWLERLREIQEDIIQGLGVPYRVLDMPTEELGASAYRKYDIEAWMPGRGKWGEISSASNCTDYQAKKLVIRYKDEMQKGQKRSTNEFVHTLNGTAVAIPRLIVALVENYGVSEAGKLKLPGILKKYWVSSAQDQIEWIGFTSEEVESTDSSSKKSAVHRALARVRSISQKSGTDTASMILSFFILHELTAIIPLVLIFYLLGLLGAGEQVMAWLLRVSENDRDGVRAWLRGKINEGMQKAESYGRKKGYFGFEAGSDTDAEKDSKASSSALIGTFANAVAAYAITKALFPLRIAACITFAGPFARVFIEPVKRVIARRRMQSRMK